MDLKDKLAKFRSYLNGRLAFDEAAQFEVLAMFNDTFARELTAEPDAVEADRDPHGTIGVDALRRIARHNGLGRLAGDARAQATVVRAAVRDFIGRMIENEVGPVEARADIDEGAPAFDEWLQGWVGEVVDV